MGGRFYYDLLINALPNFNRHIVVNNILKEFSYPFKTNKL